jgi:hypothetical protein
MSDYLDRAQEAAGNWKKFQSFGSGRWCQYFEPRDIPCGWTEDDFKPEEWYIHYSTNRDANILTQVNHNCLTKLMEPFMEADRPDVVSEVHNHWAVGWVEGFAVRCLDGLEETDAWVALCEFLDALEEYPVADDDAFSEAEFEAGIENISWIGRGMLSDDAPDGWEYQVYDLLDEDEREPRDGSGCYPSDDAVEQALRTLGFYDLENDE